MRHFVSAVSINRVAVCLAVLAMALPTVAAADGDSEAATETVEAIATDAATEADAITDSETPDAYEAEAEAQLTASATGQLSSIAVAGEFSEPPEQNAIELWDEQNQWSYGTDYLFPLTRELDDSGLPGSLQPVAMILTVPLDVVGLPLGAVAGLFGS